MTSFWHSLFRMVLGLAQMATLVVLVLSLAAYTENYHWTLALAVHFRPILFILSLGLGAYLFIVPFFLKQSRSWNWGILALLLAGLNFSPIAHTYLAQASLTAPQNSTQIKVLHLNVFSYNRPNKPLTQYLADSKTDIVDFVEYTPVWKQTLEKTGALNRFPYRTFQGQEMAVYSRFPILSEERLQTSPEGGYNNESLHVHLKIPHGGKLNLIVAHPVLPFLKEGAYLQKQAVSQWIKAGKTNENTVLAGDLNTTPWSSGFKRLLQETHLQDSRDGFGLQPTWPDFLPFIPIPNFRISALSWLGIPIDFILVSPKISVLGYQTGPVVGSDHRPVLATLALPAQK